VEFLVLGPVEVRVDGRAMSLGGPKQRVLLTLLLLNRNEVVSRDRLIDSLWGEHPPASAQRALDSYLSRVRTLLGGDRIERHAPGYRLRVEPGELDLERFEALLEQGRAAAAAGDAATARDLLVESLGLWRGGALAGVASEPALAGTARELEERRLLAVEARNDAQLALGGGPELVGELERLAAAHPFRERLLGQLMLALYRAGRQADALAVYQSCRRRYADELGLEPSAELRALERRILEQDPELGSSAPAGTARGVRAPRLLHGRRPVAAGVLAAVVASAIVGVELGTGGSSASRSESRTGIVEIAGHSAVEGPALTDAPAAMQADATSTWLAEPSANAVLRVDRATRQIETIAVGGSPSTLALTSGSAWVAGVPGDTIYRISKTSPYGVTQIHLGAGRVAALAFGLGRLWVADSARHELLALDPLTGRRLKVFPLDVRPSALAVGAGAVWITDYDDGLLTRIDPRSGAELGTIHVGDGPAAVTVGDGGVWVANSLDSTVSRVDPTSDTPGPAVPVGSYPIALAVNGPWIEVANAHSASVSRIDARSNRVVATTTVGGGPTALAAAEGQVWAGTQTLGMRRGGTLVLLHDRPDSLDTALQEDLPPQQSDGLTNDALLAYMRVGEALRLVPDLALSVPPPADGGLTYTFTLRANIPYSDGRLVRPEDFRTAIERLFRVGAGWSSNYTNIVGARACTRSACDLSQGIVVNDATRTITFHLSKPDPDFRSNMTSIGTAPVPPGVPFHDVGYTPIPGTGPYMVKSANPHEIRYVRNPRFHEWSPAQPDGNPDVIVMKFGLSPAQEVREVESGKADWTADSVPGNLLPEVLARYPAQVHSLDATETDFFQINTQIPPFNDPRVRRALNYAIDRAAILRLYGGHDAATPTCQITPPGQSGYKPYCPYTIAPGADGRWRAPNLSYARRLIAASGTKGDYVTLVGAANGGVSGTSVVRYTARLLHRLGYQPQTEIVPISDFARMAWPEVNLLTTAVQGATPFFHPWFGCSSPYDNGWVCDPALDAAIAHAQTVGETNPKAADALWANIDHNVVDQALSVPLVNPHFVDFFSKRVRNYQADPALGLVADQVSLK
jgi:ABC-type transport system substrate-binding protein/DNA-binding SARP family transcriptional activator